MAKPPDCQARQHSDQMVCHVCGLVWDVNDPYPPTCRRGRRALAESRETPVPEHNNRPANEPDAEFVREIERTWEHYGARGVYRLIVDRVLG